MRGERNKVTTAFRNIMFEFTIANIHITNFMWQRQSNAVVR